MLEKFAATPDRGQRARRRGHDRQAQARPRRLIRARASACVRTAPSWRWRSCCRSSRAAPRSARWTATSSTPSTRTRASCRASTRSGRWSATRSSTCARSRCRTAGSGAGTSSCGRSGSASWSCGRRGSRAAPDDLVIDPGVFFGAGTHATTRLCLELLLERAARRRALRLGGGDGRAGDRGRAARLGAGDGGRGRAGRARGDPRERRRATACGRRRVAARPAPRRRRGRRPSLANLRESCPARDRRPPTGSSSDLAPRRGCIASGMLAGEADEVVAAFGMLRERRRLEAEGWAGVVLAVIRLAVRVARSQAEPVLAELLELVPGGLEERDVDEDTVEYALYGAPGELPDVGELRAVAGGALVDVSTSEVSDGSDWRDWHRPLDVGPLRVRPPWAPRAPGRARRGDRSRAGVRHRRASEHAADARAAGGRAARRSAGRLGLRLGDPVRRRRPARLRSGAGVRPRARGGGRHAGGGGRRTGSS